MEKVFVKVRCSHLPDGTIRPESLEWEDGQAWEITRTIHVAAPADHEEGSIEDFGSYEDMLEWGDVKNREEYERYWLEEYPDPVCWYELVIAEAFHKDGSRWFRAVHFGDKPIINAHFDYDDEKTGFTNREEATIALCSLLTEAVGESMQKLKEGTYNEFVKTHLPYSFRTGVIPRRVLWEREPEWKESDLEGLPEKYGDIIDFIHVYGEEMEKFRDAIEWLPEEEARLI